MKDMDKDLEIMLKELDVKILTAKTPEYVKLLVRQQADLIEKSVALRFKKNKKEYTK